MMEVAKIYIVADCSMKTLTLNTVTVTLLERPQNKSYATIRAHLMLPMRLWVGKSIHIKATMTRLGYIHPMESIDYTKVTIVAAWTCLRYINIKFIRILC